MQGFTLLEVILSFALMSIIFAIGIPFYESSWTHSELAIAEHTAMHALRRASSLAQAFDGDSPWGVFIQPGSITIFQGTAYAARNTAADEVFTFAGSITPSGDLEFVFSKLTGFPQTTGSLTLTANTGQIKTITINEKGMVQ